MPAAALVVDDSMLIRYTVCRFLEERGFAVESAQVLHGALWAKLSDHAPIVATLQLKR